MNKEKVSDNIDIGVQQREFTDKLYKQTKHSHTIVDKHPFVSMIRENKIAGEMYINFNKVCIYEIQKVLHLHDSVLYSKLHRRIQESEINTLEISDQIIEHCQKHPLESAYQFYLGLLFGGNMLKRMLPDHYEFLTYDENTNGMSRKELIQEFKTYLCNNVKESDQEEFINNVNTLYDLIRDLFDCFYKKLT